MRRDSGFYTCMSFQKVKSQLFSTVHEKFIEDLQPMPQEFFQEEGRSSVMMHTFLLIFHNSIMPLCFIHAQGLIIVLY